MYNFFKIKNNFWYLIFFFCISCSNSTDFSGKMYHDKHDKSEQENNFPSELQEKPILVSSSKENFEFSAYFQCFKNPVIPHSEITYKLNFSFSIKRPFSKEPYHQIRNHSYIGLRLEFEPINSKEQVVEYLKKKFKKRKEFKLEKFEKDEKSVIDSINEAVSKFESKNPEYACISTQVNYNHNICLPIEEIIQLVVYLLPDSDFESEENLNSFLKEIAIIINLEEIEPIDLVEFYLITFLKNIPESILKKITISIELLAKDSEKKREFKKYIKENIHLLFLSIHENPIPSLYKIKLNGTDIIDDKDRITDFIIQYIGENTDEDLLSGVASLLEE